MSVWTWEVIVTTIYGKNQYMTTYQTYQSLTILCSKISKNYQKYGKKSGHKLAGYAHAIGRIKYPVEINLGRMI